VKKLVPADAVLVPDNAERVFQGVIYDVYHWTQELFDGSEATFEMLKRPDTVSVICVVDDKILLLDDEQPHTGLRQSFPGGRVDDTDESILAAAQREVLEETGYAFSNWRILKVWQPHLKTEWFVYLLLANGVRDQQEPKHDAGEKITVREIGFDDVKELVLNKSRFLADSRAVFEPLHNLEQLLAVPAFSGKEVDR
jgi:ADP-ribose pyrophosphatase